MNKIHGRRTDIGYLESLASGSSALHRLDPRVKVAATFAFIAAVVSFDKYALAALLPFFLYPAALLCVGGLPVRFFVKKIMIVAPFAVMVGLFNPLTDRQILFYAGPVGFLGGWVSFISILMRFALTVSAALCLVALTGFNNVCLALEQFGVPGPLVTQLTLLHRYLFVLTEEAERMVRARTLRSCQRAPMSVKLFASLAGCLLMRTIDRAERVYQAMRCRGFDGHVRIGGSLKIGPADIRFAGGWISFFILMRYVPLTQKMGSLAAGVIR